MRLLWFCFFGLVCKIDFVTPTKKMIVMHASTTDSGSVCYESWDDCVSICFYNSSCVGVYSNVNETITTYSGFQLSYISPNLEKTTKFAVKQDMTNDICPSGEPPLFGSPSTTNIIQTYHNNSGVEALSVFRFTITRPSDSWIFNYTRCRGSEYLYTRDSQLYCLKFFNDTANFTVASSQCSQSFGHVFTTYTLDEFAGLNSIIGSTPLRYWVDGKPECGERCAIETYVDINNNQVNGCPNRTIFCKPTYCRQCLQLVNGLFEDHDCTDTADGYICIYPSL